MPGSPLSSVRARNLMPVSFGGARLVLAVPQISRTFDPAAGSKYPSILVLLTCSPAKNPEVSWSTKFTWPKYPPFLQPPTSPKFAWFPLSVITNPPPVVKSHGAGIMCAFTGTLRKVSRPTSSAVVRNPRAIKCTFPFSVLLISRSPFALLPREGGSGNSRRCRGDHHVGHSGYGDVHGVHDRRACRGQALLIDRYDSARNRDRLIRRSRNINRHAVNREIADGGTAAAGSAQRLRSLRHHEVGGDPDAGHRDIQAGQRSLRRNLIRPTDRGRAQRFAGDSRGKAPDNQRSVARIVNSAERAGRTERRGHSQQRC